MEGLIYVLAKPRAGDMKFTSFSLHVLPSAVVRPGPAHRGLLELPKSSCKEIGVAAKFGQIVVKLGTIDEGIHHSPPVIWPL